MQPNWSKLESLARVLIVLFASTFVGALVLPLAADGTLPMTWAAWKSCLAIGLSAGIVAEVIWIRGHLAALAASLGLAAPSAPGSTTVNAITNVTASPEATQPVSVPSMRPAGFSLVEVLGALAVVGILAVLVMHADRAPASAAEPASLAVVLQDDGRLAYVEPGIADVQTSSRSDARAVAPLALEGCTNGTLNPQVVSIGTNALALLGCGLVVYSRDTGTTPINWGTVALDLAGSCGMDLEDIINDFGSTSPVAVAASSNAANVHTAATAFKARAPAGH